MELFETWPRSCTGVNCPGRHPAPFERFKAQMEDEWQVLQQTTGEQSPTLIAWEWHSCLSPNVALPDKWAAETKANYEAYQQWVKGVPDDATRRAASLTSVL